MVEFVEPEIQFTLAEPEHMEWLYSLHKRTMGSYVEQIHGWDESLQRQHFMDRAARRRDWIVWLEGSKVGMVSYLEQDDSIRVLRIEIDPQYQRQGIGSRVMLNIMHRAEAGSMAVTLRVFRINPAKQFYEKLGFVVTSETETHYYMRWAARTGAPGTSAGGGA